MENRIFDKKTEWCQNCSIWVDGRANISPTYEQVEGQTTRNTKAVNFEFDGSIISYKTFTKLFLEIHDTTQTNNLGIQYRSEIFHKNSNKKIKMRNS